MSYSNASIVVSGPSLDLRVPVADDVHALYELASDPDVTRWFSWGPYTDLEQPRAYVERCAEQRATGEQLDLLVVHRERGPAGITGLSELHRRDRRATVGTWFGREFWGTGANRESKALLAHLAFEVLALHRLTSYSNPANDRSTRALLGVGFRHEGVLRHFHRHGERWLDVNVFGMLADERPRVDPIEVRGEVPPTFVW